MSSSRPYRSCRTSGAPGTPAKELHLTGNVDTPGDNKLKPASKSTTRGKKKIRRTEDLVNLSLCFPEREKAESSPKSSIRAIHPTKNVGKSHSCNFETEATEDAKAEMKKEKSSPHAAFPERKIVRAKRFLKSRKSSEENSETKTELLEASLKKKRQRLQKQAKLVSYEVETPEPEDFLEIVEAKNETSVIIIDETIIEESKTVVVTTLENPISPSTSSESISPISVKSPVGNILHFNISNEEIQPSTSGSIKRRTFEVETSVNDITLLKSVSESGSSPPSPKSKVTVRRKWEIKSDRMSRVSPPWSEAPATPDAENTPPRSALPRNLSLLKQALAGRSFSGEKTPVMKKRRSQSFDVAAKKPVSSVKMPDFAAIHKRAFDRMENLSEYKKRKEDRARMLLSGQKPVLQSSDTGKKTQKKLRFGPSTCEKEKAFNHIPLPNTPFPNRIFKDVEESPEMPQIEKSFEPKLRILTPKNPFNFANYGNAKPQFNFGNTKPQSKLKKEEFKALIANKSKPVKATVESRRVVIKGVRSNRRFDLLMEMRKGK